MISPNGQSTAIKTVASAQGASLVPVRRENSSCPVPLGHSGPELIFLPRAPGRKLL